MVLIGTSVLSLLIKCIKIETFAIRPLVLIVPPGNQRNVAGVHLGWFLPPFIKGGGRGGFLVQARRGNSPFPPFSKGGFSAILRFIFVVHLLGRTIAHTKISQEHEEPGESLEKREQRDSSWDRVKYLFVDGVRFPMRIDEKAENIPVLTALRGLPSKGPSLFCILSL